MSDRDGMCTQQITSLTPNANMYIVFELQFMEDIYSIPCIDDITVQNPKPYQLYPASIYRPMHHP